MTKIQEETEAMLVAAEILAAAKATSFAEKEAERIAKRLAHVEIPAFERVRQTAEEELAAPGGLSDLISENYHTALSAIESKWGTPLAKSVSSLTRNRASSRARLSRRAAAPQPRPIAVLTSTSPW